MLTAGGPVRRTGLGARFHDGWIAPDPLAFAVGLGVLVLGYVPLLFLGPGTDLDVDGVYRAGRSILSGDYVASRRPGAPVFEAIAGGLHELGGPVLVNLGSLTMVVVGSAAVVLLLRREGHPFAEWLGVAVLVNPFVWIAGTSMIDHVWAIGFVLVGANLQRSRRVVPAAVLYTLGAGCRLSMLLVVAAFLLAGWLGTDRGDDADSDARAPLVAIAGLTALLVAVVFVVPALTLRGEMFAAEGATSSALVQLGRFAVKNFYFFGPVAVGLLLYLSPRVARGVRADWSTSTTLRMGVLALAVTELLFLAFPWKLAHLIPAWIAVVLVLGASRVLTTRTLAVLLLSQVLLGLLTVNVAQPNRSDRATGGRIAVEVEQGPLLRDIDCRAEASREAYRRPGGREEVLATWACAVPWSGQDGDPVED